MTFIKKLQAAQQEGLKVRLVLRPKDALTLEGVILECGEDYLIFTSRTKKKQLFQVMYRLEKVYGLCIDLPQLKAT